MTLEESPTRFEAVPKEELDRWTRGLQHRGRVSYPLLKQFMELGHPVAKLNREGLQQTTLSLSSCLSAYARNHEIPVKVSVRGGELYLIRTDIDNDGKPIQEETIKEAPKLTKATVRDQ